MLPLIAGGAVLLVIVLLVVMGGKGDDGDGTNTANNGGNKGAGTPDNVPVVEQDTVAKVKSDLRKNAPTTDRQYEHYIDRLKKLGVEGEDKLQELYEEGVESGALYGDEEARAALGYTKFAHKIPEDLSFRDYPFIRAVEEAGRKTWFGKDEDEELALAEKAWAATEVHLAKLANDNAYRAGDQIRSYVKHSDKTLGEYFYATRWAKPYLICYATKDKMSEFELMSITDRAERRKKIKELEEKRKRWDVVLDEKAALYQQLYVEYMKRYSEELGLKDLMLPWGGLPDLPPGKRSFEDGVPLVIWIFDSHESWQEYHVKHRPMPAGVGGYFLWANGWIYLFDHDPKGKRGRMSEISKNLHEGLHQLDYWFNKQMIKWRKVKNQQDWLGEGMAEYMSGVKVDKQRNVEFTGINVTRLEEMKNFAKTLKEAGKEYPIFPIHLLIQFTSYAQLMNWGARTWQIDPNWVQLFMYEQGLILVHFFHHFEDGKYLEKFNKYYKRYLQRGEGQSQAARQFRNVFGFQEDEDFDDMQREFEKYVQKFMEMDLDPYSYNPPKRDDWGDEGPPSARK